MAGEKYEAEIAVLQGQIDTIIAGAIPATSPWSNFTQAETNVLLAKLQAALSAAILGVLFKDDAAVVDTMNNLSDTFASTDYIGLDDQVWTVQSADRLIMTYGYRDKNTMRVEGYLENTSTSGTPDNLLRIKIPDGRQAKGAVIRACEVTISGVEENAIVSTLDGSNWIRIKRASGANFPNVTNALGVNFQFHFPIEPLA